MSFTGNPGTGKTTVARRMADVLHKLKYIRRNHVVTVTRDDLVGQFIGHTAPKTKEVLKKAMGGVLFIDEAYYLYRPENERDYGQEAIEILLQMMEDHREDLVVILAGYKDRMDTFFRSNPGMASRIRASHRLPGLFGGTSCCRSRRSWRARCTTGSTMRGGRRWRITSCGGWRSRGSATRARSGTQSTGRGCGWRTGCSRSGDRALDRSALETITEADIRASRVFLEPA